MANKEKQFLTEFIELYKSFPCLWKVKSKEYSNKNAKCQAYEILVEKMRLVDENANRESVVKKINSLRTTFRKELKKVLDSERSGAGAEDIYVPHLWYFNLLSFLQDQETPRRSISNMDEDNESQSSEPHDLQPEIGNNSRESQSVNICEPHTPHAKTQAPCRVGTKRKDKCDEVLELIHKRFKSPTNVDDKFALIGKTWTAKLRELPRDQALHTEKIINDVFYEAQLGNLNRHCALQINQQQQAQPLPSQSLLPYQQSMPPSQEGPSSHSSQAGSIYYEPTQPFIQRIQFDQQQSAHSQNTPRAENQPEQNESQTISKYLSTFTTL